jgi:hypothetical protein
MVVFQLSSPKENKVLRPRAVSSHAHRCPAPSEDLLHPSEVVKIGTKSFKASTTSQITTNPNQSLSVAAPSVLFARVTDQCLKAGCNTFGNLDEIHH